MPINIKGKQVPSNPSAPAANPSNETANLEGLGGTETPPAPAAETPPETPTPEQSPQSAAPTYTPPANAGFLMTGNNQQAAVNQVKAFQDLRQKLRSGAHEFYLEPGSFAKLYFLDGKLIGDGVFDTPMVATHLIQINGKWTRIVCNELTEGNCIICSSNMEGAQPMVSQLFTVINVMPYQIKSGPNRGKTLPARLQLFAATLRVREKLVKRAETRGGALAGSMFQFSRSTKQDARVGDDIEYVDSYPMDAVLKKYPTLGPDDSPTKPLDYTTVYPVLTNAEIAQLRPDMAYAAGFTAPTSNQKPAFGADPTGTLDDEIPF